MMFLTENTPFSGRYSFEIGNIRTLVDLGGIAILYAHLIQCRELRVRKELESVAECAAESVCAVQAVEREHRTDQL